MFDIVVLSDSRRPEVVAEEQRGFAAFRRGGVGPRAYYRHRPENIDRKAGNIAEWVRRHGGAYDHMRISENTVETHISRGILFLIDWFGRGGNRRPQTSKTLEAESASIDGRARNQSRH